MKALFHCLFAYSGGQPVAVFEVDENHPQRNEPLTANANGEAALKVAVVKGFSGPEFDATECPELLAAAYEMFVNDGKPSSDRIEWVKLETN